MKSIFFLSLTLLLPIVAFAAEGIPATAAQLASERLSANQARDAAKRDDAATAEQLLTALNRAPANTSWWHVETAQRLIQLAYDVPREGRSNVIPQIVARALQHLSTANSLAGSAAQKASIQVLAGRIQERYLGDHVAALASYRAAQVLAPDNPQASREAARLGTMTAHAATRASRQ